MEAEEIVRALAAADADRFRVRVLDGCMLCDGVECGRGEDVEDPAGHAESCPWRLAREWVAEHPSGEG